jgi:prepilin-type N-terminal cleavage/methylation domain-containing protein
VRRREHARRGFTLIELLVTGVVALIMLSAALALFIQGLSAQQKQRKMAEMKRSAALVMGQLTTELRQAGLGRPHGVRVGTGSGVGNVFPPSLLVAEDHGIGFIVDLARPNATLNGYSQPAGQQGSTLPNGGLAVLNELNGTCDVVEGSSYCTTDTTSQAFDYATTDSTTNCATKPDEARTCPWSLNRYQKDEYLIVADALGRWVERQISSSGVYAQNTSSGRFALQLTDDVPAELFANGPNQGFVSTPDRVFFRLNAGRWERKQCWGSVGVGSGTPPTLQLSTPCTSEGTDWEPLARAGGTPASATFTYWKADGTRLATPVAATSLKDIYRVVIRLELQRSQSSGKPLSHVAYGSITLRQ